MGGDGSFLDSVAFVGRTGVPVLGINLGRLGFLSNTRAEDVDATLAAIKERRYTIEERGVLALEGCGDGFGDRTFALNEVSLHKRDSATMIAVHAATGRPVPEHLLGRWAHRGHAHRQHRLFPQLRRPAAGPRLRCHGGHAHLAAQPQRAALRGARPQYHPPATLMPGATSTW